MLLDSGLSRDETGHLSTEKETEKIFSKLVSVHVKEGSSVRQVKRRLHLNIEWTTSATPLLHKELVVQLTDDMDPFFLYLLTLNEDDFQSLKSQQGLLVDFVSFPKRFVDLLELCLQDEHKEPPKFLLMLTMPGKSTADACLDVVEANPFKHLTHLSLIILRASDSVIRKHLATCLKALRTDRDSLQSYLRTTELDLRERLKQTQDTLSFRTLELEHAKVEMKDRIDSLQKLHADEIHIAREKFHKSKLEIEERFEYEKKELILKHTREIQQLESRLATVDSLSKDIQAKQHKSDLTIRDLRCRVLELEEELKHSKQKLHHLSKENSDISRDYHEKEKLANQLRTQVAIIERDLHDKVQALAHCQDIVQASQEHKKMLQEQLEEKQTQLTKQKSSVKTLSEEVTKGNEIIQKLQGELRTCHAKVKLRGKITTKQEEVLKEKEDQIEQLQKEVGVLKGTAKEKEAEISKLASMVEDMKHGLEENEKQLQTNENVISWLNKQLNEHQVKSTTVGSSFPQYPVFTSTPAIRHPGIPGQGTTGLGFRGNAPLVRPPSTQVSYNNTQGYAHGMAAGANVVRYSAPSVGPTTEEHFSGGGDSNKGNAANIHTQKQGVHSTPTLLQTSVQPAAGSKNTSNRKEMPGNAGRQVAPKTHQPTTSQALRPPPLSAYFPNMAHSK